MRAVFEPLRLPRFRRLLGAYGVNITGDWLGEIALAVVLLHSGGGVVAVGALWVLGRFVPALVAPFVAALLQSRGPARLLAAVHGSEALLFAALAVTAAAHAPPALLLALAAADGVLAVTARGLLRGAIVAETRPVGLLREGNTLINMLFTAAIAAGPVMAGVLIAIAGVPVALALDAASFALAAALLYPQAATAPAEPGCAPLAPLRRGLRHVHAHRRLRRLLAMDGTTSVFLATIVPVEIVFVTETLGGSEADYGAVLTAWGIGAVASGAAMPAMRRVPLLALVSVGLLVMIASYAGMGAARTVDAVIVWSLIGGIGNGIEGMALMTAIQERTPDRLQEQVNTLIESLQTVAPGTGYALGTLVAAAASPRTAYGLAVAGALAAFVFAAPRPRLRERQALAAAAASATGNIVDAEQRGVDMAFKR